MCCPPDTQGASQASLRKRRVPLTPAWSSTKDRPGKLCLVWPQGDCLQPEGKNGSQEVLEPGRGLNSTLSMALAKPPPSAGAGNEFGMKDRPHPPPPPPEARAQRGQGWPRHRGEPSCAGLRAEGPFEPAHIPGDCGLFRPCPHVGSFVLRSDNSSSYHFVSSSLRSALCVLARF